MPGPNDRKRNAQRMAESSPGVMTTRQIADMFEITSAAVLFWVKQRWITPLPPPPGWPSRGPFGGHRFAAKDIREAIRVGVLPPPQGRKRKHPPSPAQGALPLAELAESA